MDKASLMYLLQLLQGLNHNPIHSGRLPAEFRRIEFTRGSEEGWEEETDETLMLVCLPQCDGDLQKIRQNSLLDFYSQPFVDDTGCFVLRAQGDNLVPCDLLYEQYERQDSDFGNLADIWGRLLAYDDKLTIVSTVTWSRSYPMSMMRKDKEKLCSPGNMQGRGEYGRTWLHPSLVRT